MFIVLALIVTVLIILLLRPWARRQCRWREDRRHPGEGSRFVCAACGASEITQNGRIPGDCRAVRRRR
jgi:hypothetical protein